MYQFAAEQQTSTAKLPAFFQRFQTEERVLRVNRLKMGSFESWCANLLPGDTGGI